MPVTGFGKPTRPPRPRCPVKWIVEDLNRFLGGWAALLRAQRARAMGSEGGGLDDLIACVRKLVFASG